MRVKISTTLEYESARPKSHAYGTRTAEGILIKVWVPNDLVGKKHPEELAVVLTLPIAEKGKKGKKGRDEEADEDFEEEE